MAPIPPIGGAPGGGNLPPQLAKQFFANGPTKDAIRKALAKAVGHAMRITGGEGGAGLMSKTAEFGARNSARAMARSAGGFLGRSAATSVGGGIAGSSIAGVIIGVAVILVAAAIIYYFWKKRQEAKDNPQKLEQIQREEDKAMEDLKSIESDAMKEPFKWVPRPGKAG